MSAFRQSFFWVALCFVALAGLAPSNALAQDFRTEPRAEPWWFKGDIAVAFPLSDPYRDFYGVGVNGGGALYRSAFPYVSFGARLAGGFLSEDGDQGNLRFGTLSGVTRFLPLAMLTPDQRGASLWLEAGIGGALVEGDVRLLFEGAIGYNFALRNFAVGPFFRVNHVVERDTDDLFIGLAGIELVFGGHVDDRTR